MRRRDCLGLFAATVALSGCARHRGTAPDRYTTASLLGLQVAGVLPSTFHVPALGTKVTAAVGMPMVSLRSFNVKDYVTVSGSSAVTWSSDSGEDQYRIDLGSGRYVVTHLDGEGSRYFGEFRSSVLEYERGKLNDEDEIVVMYKLTKAGVLWLLWRSPDDSTIKRKVVEGLTCTVKNEPSGTQNNEFRKELVYTGRSGKTISILYREYSNDMVRPAFTQQLQYDLEKDSVIGYQAARLSVSSATNTEVTYQVVSQLTLA